MHQVAVAGAVEAVVNAAGATGDAVSLLSSCCSCYVGRFLFCCDPIFKDSSTN